MLTISNGWMSNTISQDRVIRVVRAGQESVSSSAPDHSRDIGAWGAFVDLTFCRGVKRTVLNALYDMSQKSALLKIESDRPELQKNSALILQYQSEIARSRSTISALSHGTSVELRRNDAGEHSAEQSYLIIRKKNQLAPSGLPLYRQIAAAALPAPAAPLTMPSFAHPGQIQCADLVRLKNSQCLRCGRTMLTLRFADNDEPLVMWGNANQQSRLIQRLLSMLWIRDQAQSCLTKLDENQKVDARLNLHPVFLGLGEGGQYSEHEQSERQIWDLLAADIQKDFNAAVLRIQLPQDAEHGRLARELGQITTCRQPTMAEKSRVFAIRSGIAELAEKRNKVNKNILRLKSEFSHLCHQISYCKDPVMVDIFMMRIINFQLQISAFSQSRMGPQEVARFNRMLQTQNEFLRNCGPDQLEQLRRVMNPEPTAASRHYRVIPAASDVHKSALTVLLKDPTVSWAAVEAAASRLGTENKKLLQSKISQKKLTVLLRRELRKMVSTGNAAGINPGMDADTGLSYYTPETYTRILSLKQILAELQNMNNSFSKTTLATLKTRIKTHLAQIKTETDLIQGEQGAFLTQRSARHAPLRDSTGLLNYEQWTNQKKSEQIISTLRDVHTINIKNIAILKRRGARIKHVSGLSGSSRQSVITFSQKSTQLRGTMARR